MSNPGLRAHRRRTIIVPALGLCVASFAGVAQAEALSAEGAVSRAARENPSLRAALLDAAAAQHAARAEKGARDPNLVASVQGEHSENISRPGLSGGQGIDGAASRSIGNSIDANAALRYTTDIGTELELGTAAGTSWNRTTWSGASPLPENLQIGPTYTAQAYLSARQPLLRGAGRDSQLAPLRQAESAARAAESRRELDASQTALDVLSAYWELWYADRAVLVQEQALGVAQRLSSDAKLRANTLGTGSEVDVLQFSTSAASIADALSQARAARTTRAIELGRVLGLAPAQSAALEAVSDPPELGPAPAIDGLTRELRATSPELAALRSDLERAQSRAAVARDADRPRVDLFATASVGTLWDDSADFSLSGGRPTYGVVGGVELELPLGSGRYSEDAARARAELAAAEARYQAEVDALSASVSSLGVNLDAAREQVELTTQTAATAGKLAEAERQRALLGTTTSQNVVTAEQTLREAELRRLRALVSQLSTRFELEHSTGKLLDRFAAVL